MQRIVVLGCAGTGKTTFARDLAEAIGAPVVILDEIWQPKWSSADLQVFRGLLRDAHAGDCWVSDGNFALTTFDLRLPRADLVVWLERPPWVCLWRASLRVFRSGEAHRLEDLHKVWAFIWSFDRVSRPRIETALKQAGPTVAVTHLRTSREVKSFLSRARALEKSARPV